MAQKRSGGEINFEASLQKLEAIVKRLEEEEIPLESSLKLFTEGQSLARACEEQLRAAENQIRQLLETPSGAITEEPLRPELLREAGAGEETGSKEEDSTPPANPTNPTNPTDPAAKKKRPDTSSNPNPTAGLGDDALPF